MSIHFGQYLPLHSVIHQLDSRTRLVGFVVLFLAILISGSLWGLSVAFLLILFAIYLSRVPFSLFIPSIKSPLPFLLLLAVVQILFMGHEPYLFEWGIIKIGEHGLTLGALLLLRFLNLILLLSLVSYTLSVTQLMQGLSYPLRKIGIPTQDLLISVQVTFQFIPFLFQTIERISKAQAARGADWDNVHAGLIQKARQVLPIIVPLFVITLRRAETLALALDARGYRSDATPKKPSNSKPISCLELLGVGLVVFVALIIILI